MATQSTDQAATSKTKKVTLLKTVQIEPGKAPLAPGEHTLSTAVANDLIKDGLAE
tara:strand:+ start:131 stop:295 length:165 start_codon:yes stop_codon:yes gene_type:complete